MTDRLFSVEEVAQRAGISPARVRFYCQRGRIEARKAGRSWTITPHALQKFLAKPRRAGRPWPSKDTT